MTIRPEDNRPPLDPEKQIQDVTERVDPVGLEETERPVKDEFETAIDQERVAREEIRDTAEIPRVERDPNTYVNDSYNDEFVGTEQSPKKNKWIIIGVLAVIIALVVFFFVNSVFASPKGKILDAIGKLEEDAKAYNEEFYPDLGFNQINEQWYEGKGSFALDFDVNAQSTAMDETNISVAFHSGVNVADKFSYTQLDYGIGDIAAVGANVQMNGDVFSLALPNLMEDVLGVDLSTFGQAMSASPVFGNQFADELDDLSFHLWEGETTPKEIKEAYLAYVRDQVADLGKDITVEKSESAVNATIGEEEVALETYDVGIPNAKLSTLVQRSLDYLYELAKKKISYSDWSEADENIEEQKSEIAAWFAEQKETLDFRIGLGSDNRIRYFEVVLEDDGQQGAIEIYALGEDNPFKNYSFIASNIEGEARTVATAMSAVTTIATGENTLDMTFEDQRQDPTEMQMVYDTEAKEMLMHIDTPISQDGQTQRQTLRVQFTDIVPGEKVSFVVTPETQASIDPALVADAMEIRLTIGGAPTDVAEQAPTKLIPDMTQAEFQTVFMSVIQSAQTMFGPLMNTLPSGI